MVCSWSITALQSLIVLRQTTHLGSQFYTQYHLTWLWVSILYVHAHTANYTQLFASQFYTHNLASSSSVGSELIWPLALCWCLWSWLSLTGNIGLDVFYTYVYEHISYNYYVASYVALMANCTHFIAFGSQFYTHHLYRFKFDY